MNKEDLKTINDIVDKFIETHEVIIVDGEEVFLIGVDGDRKFFSHIRYEIECSYQTFASALGDEIGMGIKEKLREKYGV